MARPHRRLPVECERGVSNRWLSPLASTCLRLLVVGTIAASYRARSSTAHRRAHSAKIISSPHSCRLRFSPFLGRGFNLRAASISRVRAWDRPGEQLREALANLSLVLPAPKRHRPLPSSPAARPAREYDGSSRAPSSPACSGTRHRDVRTPTSGLISPLTSIVYSSCSGDHGSFRRGRPLVGQEAVASDEALANARIAR